MRARTLGVALATAVLVGGCAGVPAGPVANERTARPPGAGATNDRTPAPPLADASTKGGAGESAAVREPLEPQLAEVGRTPTEWATRRDVPAEPEPVATPAPLAAFAMNLYRDGDFVPQYTFEWCVAASVQMAFNLVGDESRTAREDQQALWERARDLSSNPYRGADPGGWTGLLNEIGIGPYELVSIPEFDDALRVAARAMRETDRPVGLVMWRGRHAWVMNGFEALGDPALNRDFRLTGIRVMDPLYPHGSSIWGPSPAPNTMFTPDELAKQFVFREKRRWSSHVPAGFLLVLPVAPQAATGVLAWDPSTGQHHALAVTAVH